MDADGGIDAAGYLLTLTGIELHVLAGRGEQGFTFIADWVSDSR